MPNRTIFQRAEINHRANWTFRTNTRLNARVWACNDCGHKVFASTQIGPDPDSFFRTFLREVVRHEATCGTSQPRRSAQSGLNPMRSVEQQHGNWTVTTSRRSRSIRVWSCNDCQQRVFVSLATHNPAETLRSHLRFIRRHEQECAQAPVAI